MGRVMAGGEPSPVLEDLLTALGDAGQRLTELGACEGAAGNISVLVTGPVRLEARFPRVERLRLPQPVPALAGRTVIASGAGRRLRDIGRDPEGNLGALIVDPGGETGTLHTALRPRFERLTSEFNSHLAVHQDQVETAGAAFSAVIHAQPPHLTYLSHLARYQDPAIMNRRLLRWEPETIVQFPQGVGVLPFILPGSAELMRATVEALRIHPVAIWGKHGVMVRSDVSVDAAVDAIDYLEAAARYEYLDQVAGGRAEGLTDDELRQIASAVGVETTLL